MTNGGDIEKLEAILEGASGESWALAAAADGDPVVEVRFADGHAEQWQVVRDPGPTPSADVEFIANSRRDLERLLASARGRTSLTDGELDDIEHRCGAAAPAPWLVLLESEGGLGGENVIIVSEGDDELNLYIWRERRSAPDPDWELAGAARNEIPNLIARIRESPRQ